MFHKILVALDDDSSQQIFAEAITLAKATNASLMLLHVLSPFEGEYPGSIYPAIDGIYPGLHRQTIQIYMSQWHQFEQQALDSLRSLSCQAAEAGVPAEFTQSLGDPGRIICNLARTWDADLVMVGRRGRAGLSEFFLGSVSNYVLHHAPCSVLTIQGLTKAPQSDEQLQPDVAIAR
ncbi:MAG: universal stress protein [Phormidesmis sp. CAN_BIN36]|nr:universal stress protein [Phormidesmis sp. CAN_BIN36]